MSPITSCRQQGHRAGITSGSNRAQKSSHFLYVDLDDFKAFNDYYGFTAGAT